MAPERLLVFDVDGPVQNFAAAVGRVPGLQFMDEHELEDGSAMAYLLLPDCRALTELLSLWRRWQEGRSLETGFTPWRDVFASLRDLRVWGPSDRVTADDRAALAEDADVGDTGIVRVEVELVFHPGSIAASQAEEAVRQAVNAAGGQTADRSRIESIAYHAVLATLPVAAVRSIATLAPGSIASLETVMHIRPQAVSFGISTADPIRSPFLPAALPTGTPIVALLDGVPVSEHPMLAGRLRVEDLFDFDENIQARHRRHGTAMVSLLVRGDLNRNEPPLGRPITVVPVMNWNGTDEALPADRLIVDVTYQAITALRAGSDPLAPDVLVVNISLGNLRRPFHGGMSPWARLLDRMAWEYGILFVVSAGNVMDRFAIAGFDGYVDFEAADSLERAAATLAALQSMAPDRPIISPAETVNGLTVGAANDDAVDPTNRRAATVNLDPYPDYRMANPSSRLGPGFAGAVKPDVLMPGGREHIRTVNNVGSWEVKPAVAARSFGLRVAAPAIDQGTADQHFTSGTSAAAALASRTCHLIHDALERAYGRAFLDLSHVQRALCLKAIFAHGARWPDGTAELIRQTLGPHGQGQASKQRDNVRRFCGYGMVDPEDVVACAADRATFWATGMIGRQEAIRIDVPVPACMGGQAKPHELMATLAWFTPVQPGRRAYRLVRLSLLEPPELADLRVKGASAHPDANQVKRGTLLSRRWTGDRAPVVSTGMSVSLMVQREPDGSDACDEPIPFAVAATLAMPTVVDLYDEVRARLAISLQIQP